jgi:Reverse transcriptase (RNA-dependent DNA polymerase)
MPIFDPGFSNSSHGFRPGRSAHDAVRAAQSYVAAGNRFVVDLDLEKFFDRVNHDVLMARVVRKVNDKQALRRSTRNDPMGASIPFRLPFWKTGACGAYENAQSVVLNMFFGAGCDAFACLIVKRLVKPIAA